MGTTLFEARNKNQKYQQFGLYGDIVWSVPFFQHLQCIFLNFEFKKPICFTKCICPPWPTDIRGQYAGINDYL